MATPKKTSANLKHSKNKVTPKKVSIISRSKQWFAHINIYVACSFGILLVTTLIWSILSAQIQLNNADQLVNSMLLESNAVFHNAIFPGTHSFLFKLPLFLLIKLLGGNAFAYTSVTVLVTLLTVVSFAYILRRIEKRPAVISVLYLALAACLLLIPAQPYFGSLLPTNMAMVTTRNIEYIVLIIGLLFVIKSNRVRSLSLVFSCLIFGLLFASDRLFFLLSIGGAALSLVFYVLVKHTEFIKLSVRWLVASLAGYGLSIGMLVLLNVTNLFHTVNAVTSSPYESIYSAKVFLIGFVYTILGILTNFGANSIVDVKVIKDIPSQLIGRALSIEAVPFLITFGIAILGMASMLVLIKKSIFRTPKKHGHRKEVVPDKAFRLSIMLIWTSAAAIGLFIFSNHYYPVDARYLAIILFAGFISLATYTRTKTYAKQAIMKVGLVIVIGIIISVPFVLQTSRTSTESTKDATNRNKTVEQVLRQHPGSILVGDYWRVLPIKLASPGIAVAPLEGCTVNRSTLTSKAWQPDLHTHSFAYLLSLNSISENYPHCDLNQIITAYGKPNSSSVISGTLNNPKELLLFYDGGIHPPLAAPAKNNTKDTVLPISINDIPGRICSKATIMNFSAHEDDDILFMNPDLQHDIEQGHCVRSVYFTAGDAGDSTEYWVGRQKGTESAYDKMLGKENQIWTERIVTLPKGQFLTVTNPKGNRDISLIFLHLPDGNLRGQGFLSTSNESLRKLYTNQIGSMKTVDHSSSYNADQLVDGIETILKAYAPTQVRSQSSYAGGGKMYADHSDHTYVARFTTQAYNKYVATLPAESVPPITYYLGYPVHSLPQNVSDGDLEKKVQTFMAFGKYDGAVCHTIYECDVHAVYGIYLRRQYTYPY